MKKILITIVCILTYTFAFSQLSLIETHQSPSCYGSCNGIIAVTPNNAIGAVTYTWLPLGTVNYSLCAGQYTVMAEDAGANTASLSVTITQPTQMIATAIAQNSITCTCNGSASVTVTGGNAPYNYIWNTPFSNNMPQVMNLCPGVSSVNITDINGCIATTTVAIMPAQSPIYTTTVANSSCQAICNGSVTAVVSSGIAPYTYMWQFYDGQSFQTYTTASVQNLCVSSATLVVTDAVGCATASTVNIGVLNSNIPNTSITSISYDETCHLSGDGAIDVSISGSNPGPFTYTWSNGANSQDVTNIVSNSYWVSIQDANSNCVTIMDTVHSMGTNCGTISGNVYVDNNSNCSYDALIDNNAIYSMVHIQPGNRYGYVNPNGSYVVNDLPYGTYTVTATSNIIFYTTTCTQTISTTVNASNPVVINNNLFVGFNSGTQPDMTVWAYSNGIVPGFLSHVNYYLANLNNVNASGIYKITLPPSFISNITSCTPSNYTISGDTVMWNFNNIGFNFNYWYAPPMFTVEFIPPLSTPLGSTFTSCIYAQPNVTDFNYANNTSCYSRIVTGSFDPNDKTVSPVGVGSNGDIAASETDLTYLIRFQNTGNGPAVNIVVKDTLSANVDVNTFEMLGSSHNYNIDILTGNVLRWKFNNIMLADSGSNEPASHGYIHYRIKRNSNNTPGTQIKNTAYIYFDFNEPVVTNTAINTIETITGIKSQLANDHGWNVYPNPSNGILHIVNSSSIKDESTIQILNSMGQTVLEETMSSNYKNIDLSKLTNGVYFVKISSVTSSAVKRIVLNK